MVIINISDHFVRYKVTGKPRRVFGVLLGFQSGRRVEVTTSFELLVNDDATRAIDTDFVKKQLQQYSHVFEKIEIIGWYATGKTVENYDLKIHQQIEQYNETPLLLLLNPELAQGSRELPLSLWETTIKSGGDDKPTVLFSKVAYYVETTEAERIAVDYLQNVSTGGKSLLTSHLTAIHNSIKMLNLRIKMIVQFLQSNQAKEGNEAILRQINGLVQQLPAINSDKFKEDFLTEYNDALLVTYLATITRTSHAVNEMVEKFNITFDKHARRRGFM